MTTVDERSTRPQRMLVYLAVGVVLGGLLVAGYLLFHSARATAEAEAKADRLVTRLTQEGARAPSRDQLVRLLGADGGSICVDPAAALARATSDTGIANGAGGPGTRPVLAPDTVVHAQLLVIEVYCPGKLAGFQEYVGGLGFAGAAGG
ncbi:hypothetical protein [Amycolatopsis sp. RTGN1]|uniref:hypothetical protein n=1 Tax=Amycolatopsis ponsaeliensis TaxID=2992142 RepID=UPI00254B5C8A|nr:hypothetical protein [Amycolatopsis sp. RTGN1]